MTVLPTGFHSTRFVFRLSGVVDSFGFGLAFGPWGDGNVSEDTANIVRDSWVSSAMWTDATTSTEFTWESVIDTQQLPSGPVTFELSVNQNGSVTVATVPINTSGLVRKVTGLGGATNRGRFYLPLYNLGENSVSAAGVIAAASVNAINDRLNTFMTTIATEGLDPVLLHSDPVETPTPITGLVLQGTCGTQRRRMR